MIRRRFFAVASAISLLVCLASVGLWLRTYWACDGWFVALGHGHNLASYTFAELEAASGCCEIIVEQTFHGDDAMDWGHEVVDSFPDIDDPSRNRFGVRWLAGGPFGGKAVVFPVWYGVIGFGLMPALRLLLSRRWQPGTCKQCSYDLTGNTSGICPECGTPVPKEPAENSPRMV